MKVLNFGSMNQDFTYRVSHIVQEGETIASGSMEVFPGGKGLNQSIALSKAGIGPYHAGLIGKDGEWLIDFCKASGVDTSYIDICAEKTGTAFIQLDDEGKNSIILYKGANQMITKNMVQKVLGDFGKDDLVLLQNEINCSEEILNSAKEREMKVILNPSPCTEDILHWELEKTDLLILNEIEGKQLTAKTEPKEIMDNLTQKYKDTKLVLTMGSRGSFFSDYKYRCFQPAIKVGVKDTTGAGDTFTGYFVKAYFVDRKSPAESLLTATVAAALAVTGKGAAVSIPAAKEVERFMEEGERDADWMFWETGSAGCY